MIGSIIGDIIGSRYEGDMSITQPESLLQDDCDFTDDTVLICAVSDALQTGKPVRQALKDWANHYPGRGYGGWFLSWVINDEGEDQGESRSNGAGMRISPLAKLCKAENAVATCEEITSLTHNTDEGHCGAKSVLAATMAALASGSKIEVRMAAEQYGWPTRKMAYHQQDQNFDERCAESVPRAIACAIEADSFDAVMRNCLRLGGDVDTIAAMAGGIAEGLYGIPPDYTHWAWDKLPHEMRNVILGEYLVTDVRALAALLAPSRPAPGPTFDESDLFLSSTPTASPLSGLVDRVRRLFS